MRPKERIPLVLENIPLDDFINSFDIFEDPSYVKDVVKSLDMKKLQDVWEENPDWRLTQLLVNTGAIPNTPGFWYHKEEVDWIIENEIMDARDILHWGVNFDADMVRLPETEWRPISSLNTDHINAILEGAFTKNPQYLQVFQEELELRKVDVCELHICSVCFTDVGADEKVDGKYICHDCCCDKDFLES